MKKAVAEVEVMFSMLDRDGDRASVDAVLSATMEYGMLRIKDVGPQHHRGQGAARSSKSSRPRCEASRRPSPPRCHRPHQRGGWPPRPGLPA